MRIGMVAPLDIRVPPVAYGGTEMVVSLLSEELVRLGHEVTLFASGDSVTSARLVSVCPTFLRGSECDADILNMLNMMTCMERARDFDIIHNHTLLEGMATAGLVKTPMLTTLHGGMQGDSLLLFHYYKGWHNTISKSSKSLLPPKERFAGVIYNAIDVPSYPCNQGPREDFLLFLSRMSHEKGPHLAIDVARRLGARLILAGNVHRVDEAYFGEMVLPLVDGDQVRYVGEVDGQRKRELFAATRCLLAPILWPEPFGLFMAEAMACGAPVVAFRRGAAPEVVEDGVTGFIVDTVEQMAEAVLRVGGISSSSCRQRVEEKFDAPRLADDYLAAYHRICEAEGAAKADYSLRLEQSFMATFPEPASPV